MKSNTIKDLPQLRQEIDKVDHQLISLLAERLQLVQQVGMYKKAHHLPPLDQQRWQQVLKQRSTQGKALGLTAPFVEEVWNRIHQEALRIEHET